MTLKTLSRFVLLTFEADLEVPLNVLWWPPPIDSGAPLQAPPSRRATFVSAVFEADAVVRSEQCVLRLLLLFWLLFSLTADLVELRSPLLKRLGTLERLKDWTPLIVRLYVRVCRAVLYTGFLFDVLYAFVSKVDGSLSVSGRI